MINSVEGHQFISFSCASDEASVHGAGCECGERYDWRAREEQHDRHVLSIVWDDGRESVARDFLRPAVDGIRAGSPNPYRGDRHVR